MENQVKCNLTMNIKLTKDIFIELLTTDKSTIFCLKEIFFEESEIKIVHIETITDLFRHWQINYDDFSVNDMKESIDFTKNKYLYTRTLNNDGTSNYFIKEKYVR